jgi:glycosyltransferase involved in cell wall biosynthesis
MTGTSSDDVREALVKFSILTPCFNEEASVRQCAEAVAEVFRTKLPEHDYEHVFCDNASTDKTVDVLRDIAAHDPRVKVAVNSRNVGPMRNTVNGLKYLDGDVVVPFIPADLQDPPQVIPELFEALASDVDVVYGIRHDRQDPLHLRISRGLYYRLASFISGGVTPPNHAGDFMLARRHVIDAVVGTGGHQFYLRGLVAQTEPRYATRMYAWGVREHGKSRNSYPALIDQAFIGLLSLAKSPLRWAMPVGFVASMLGLLYAMATVALKAFGVGGGDAGIATLIVGVFLFGGLQLFILGVVGEYVLNMHRSVNPPPPVIERERINL